MARVLVLGSSNTDMTRAAAPAAAPGQTVLGGSFLTGPGGKGANQAVAAARAGGEVVFVTAVGDDAFGRGGAGRLPPRGDRRRARPDRRRGGLGRRADLRRRRRREHDRRRPRRQRRARPRRRRPPARRPVRARTACSSSPAWKCPMAAVRGPSAGRRAAGMTVVLNPAPFDPELVDLGPPGGRRRADPQPGRAGASSRGIDTETVEGELEAAEALQAMGRPLGVVVTLGADGCLVLARRPRGHRSPPHPVDAVDTVGAGDAFNGALAVALAEGRPLVEAAAWATAAAALAVTRPGAQGALPVPRRDRPARRRRAPP